MDLSRPGGHWHTSVMTIWQCKFNVVYIIKTTKTSETLLGTSTSTGNEESLKCFFCSWT